MKLPVALFASVVWAGLVWADLTATITGPPFFNDTDDFKFTTTITNTGSEDVTLLNAPSSAVAPKFATNIFGVISDDGTPAKFTGIALKWDQASAMAAKDFTIVKAGESIEVEQDYSGVYDFSESGESTYKINGGSDFHVVSPSGEVSTYVATVIGHTTKVAGKLVSNKTAGDPIKRSSTRVKAPQYGGCDSAQISQLALAAPQANAYAGGATSYLGILRQSSVRFTTWFGPFDVGRRNTLFGHYSHINLDATSSGLTYDCSTCPGTANREAYAYVYSNKPNRIYLCAAFWRAPLTGTDSKAGTIIHELSHFSVNAGTRDYAYGQAAARALAVSNPAHALQNADSHEYFVENTPYLA